eukprot:3970020-Amphidinium_carterae.1
MTKTDKPKKDFREGLLPPCEVVYVLNGVTPSMSNAAHESQMVECIVCQKKCTVPTRMSRT